MDNLYIYIEQMAEGHGYKNITEFCKAVKIPRATMSELKSGRTKQLSAKTANVISDALDIPLDVLLGKQVVMNIKFDTKALPKKEQPPVSKELSEAKKAMYEFVDGLSDEQVHRLLQIARAAFEK